MMNATLPAHGHGLPCAPSEVDDFLSQPSDRVCDVLARIPGPILVLGAGGKIGLHLTLMLRRAFDRLGRRDPVYAVSRFRTLRQRSDFERRGVIVHPCDLSNPDELAGLPDCPTAFFLAGAKFGTSDSPELLRETNVVVPERVAARFPGVRLVAFSTGCVYPFVSFDSGGAAEDVPVSAVGEYAASCIEREHVFARASQQHGNPVVLLRLNYSVEFRYGVLVDIAERVFRGVPVDVTMGYVNVIWQSDAVANFIQALEVAKSPAVPLNVTGPDVLSVRALAHRFGDLLGREVQITGEEKRTAWLSSSARARQLFGAPAVSAETMMRWISLWLQQGGSTWGKPTGFENREGKF